jgi:hypothetical protein
VFHTKQSSEPGAQDSLFVRVRNAGTAYTPTMQAAAQSAQAAAQSAQAAAQTAAQTAAQGMGRQVRQGTYSARGWAAPRLESAADYYMGTVSPRVADALRSTARQVRPEEPASSRRSLRSALSMSVLGLAVLAAAGAVAALVRRQYKAAMHADGEGDVVNVGDANEPTATTPAPVPGQASAPSETGTQNQSKVGTDSGTGTGQKHSSGW